MPASLSDKLSTIVEEKAFMIRLDLKREPHWLDHLVQCRAPAYAVSASSRPIRAIKDRIRPCSPSVPASGQRGAQPSENDGQDSRATGPQPVTSGSTRNATTAPAQSESRTTPPDNNLDKHRRGHDLGVGIRSTPCLPIPDTGFDWSIP